LRRNRAHGEEVRLRQTTWKGDLHSKVILAVITMSLVGLLAASSLRKAEAQKELTDFDRRILTKALVTEFMEKMCATPRTEVLMPYISKEYFESRWLDPTDFVVNSYSPSDFWILEVELPYVDVELAFGTASDKTAQLRFKVVVEQNKLLLFPSTAEKTMYGNWVDPWWASKGVGMAGQDLHTVKRLLGRPAKETESKEETFPPRPFLFENVELWKIFRVRSGAVLGTSLTGEVLNQSGVSYDKIAWFKVTLYNSAGEALGFREFAVQDLKDGEKKPFEVRFHDIMPGDVSDWKIEFDRGS